MTAKTAPPNRRQPGDVGGPPRHAAGVHAGAAALVDGGRTVTYAELARRVGALGRP